MHPGSFIYPRSHAHHLADERVPIGERIGHGGVLHALDGGVELGESIEREVGEWLARAFSAGVMQVSLACGCGVISDLTACSTTTARMCRACFPMPKMLHHGPGARAAESWQGRGEGEGRKCLCAFVEFSSEDFELCAGAGKVAFSQHASKGAPRSSGRDLRAEELPQIHCLPHLTTVERV